MPENRQIAIFCSSSNSIDSKYNEAARMLIRGLCERGFGIVSGGAVRGTMGVVADEAEKCGARNKGVLPVFMKEFEYPGLTEVVMTDTMAQRKEEMRRGTWACIALPGGIGTMDELMETIVLAKLGQYDGKVLALDLDGFYAPVKRLLDHYVETSMMTEEEKGLVAFPAGVDEMLGVIDKWG